VNSRNTIIAIIATLSASLALANDFKTNGGKDYKDATVNRVGRGEDRLVKPPICEFQP